MRLPRSPDRLIQDVHQNGARKSQYLRRSMGETPNHDNSSATFVGSSSKISPKNHPESNVSLRSEMIENDSKNESHKDILPTTSTTQEKDKEFITPSVTPTAARKNRRRSNIFTPSKKQGSANEDKANFHPHMGSGRSIPTRQGYLYKKSNKSFSKDWKKKYVTLCDDGRMTYHPSLHVSLNLF